MTAPPDDLTVVAAADWTADDWQTVMGEVLVGDGREGTLNPDGIDGVSPTLSGVSTDGGGMVVDRRWSTIEMGLGVLDEAYLSFKVHIDEAMLTLSPFAGKIGLFWGHPDHPTTGLAGGGSRPEGAWSVRIILFPNGRCGSYIYAEHPVDDDYPYGVANSAAAWKSGWNTVLAHVKMNTPGDNNGLLRLWLNGELINIYTDVQWIPDGYGDEAGIYLTGPHWYLNEMEAIPAGLELHFADIELLTPT